MTQVNENKSIRFGLNTKGNDNQSLNDLNIEPGYLVGCINSMKVVGAIKTRFFYLSMETKEVRDVTRELSYAIDKFNEEAKKIRETGEYSMLIPYDYVDGLVEYSHGCGLSHYLQESVFERLAEIGKDILTFPLMGCTLSMYTPSDVENILGCVGSFDLKITDALREQFLYF
ncbi:MULTISPECIES: hypothetical protein [Bacillus cereus group]|uniref:Uncharacterized protein n=1 Tax=Bacillus cereus TaxID=1396 RepID=A0A9X6W307_BACCE|nr:MULTISPECIES: hypothetical protein [Bacillus cereus group]PEZ75156.1 hypothetical protein CN410_13640 [Bacillus anthracis]PES55545.1 hypothetical protein CN515_05740 [Bacillus cereus]PFF52038.1 hypothetical protein CN357_04940 [Bacillus cereus]PFQ39746.1 hypothetical protein COK33_09860 [Bacillus cereus]PGB15677.1 hypothetical protein COM09_08840 [Bacillus toyonensis]